jgi:RimJ/RimL family protein N-acetyltransferase
MMLTGSSVRLNLNPSITSDVRNVWRYARRHLVEPGLSKQTELEDFVSSCTVFATIEHTRRSKNLSAPNKAFTKSVSILQQSSSPSSIRPLILAKPNVSTWPTRSPPTADLTVDPSKSEGVYRMDPVWPWQLVAFKPNASQTDCGTEIIGVIYLHGTKSNSSGMEAALGIGVLPSWRGKGIGTEAVDLLLNWAFRDLIIDEVPLRRVIARIAHCSEDHAWIRASSFFEDLSFEQESYSPKAFRCCSAEWIDASVYVILDMHWSMKDSVRKMRETRKLQMARMTDGNKRKRSGADSLTTTDNEKRRKIYV